MEFITPIVRPSAAAAVAGSEHESARSLPAEAVEKEHMFDKVVTPSDVGKLNRLVIPKQHAEKYFPLDAASNEKGLLLSFEDRTGKPWRFRYSYWNSSQSYVMTKGWSRFVKEKRLDAGDTVSFGRGVGEAARGRLFIDWRRRPDVVAALAPPTHRFQLPSSVPFAPWAHHHGAAGASARFLLPPSTPIYDRRRHHAHSHAVGYDAYAAPTSRQVLFYRPLPQQQHPAVVLESVPVRMTAGHAEPSVASSAPSKRVRLFGVNLDCANTEEDDAGIGKTVPPPPPPQLPSPPSSPSSSSGKARCSLNLDL